MFGGKGVVNSEKDRESHGQSNVRDEVDGQEKTLMDMLGLS